MLVSNEGPRFAPQPQSNPIRFNRSRGTASQTSRPAEFAPLIPKNPPAIWFPAKLINLAPRMQLAQGGANRRGLRGAVEACRAIRNMESTSPGESRAYLVVVAVVAAVAVTGGAERSRCETGRDGRRRVGFWGPRMATREAERFSN